MHNVIDYPSRFLYFLFKWNLIHESEDKTFLMIKIIFMKVRYEMLCLRLQKKQF
jgi:hypothetical protein